MQIITHFGDNVNKMEDTALKMAYVPVRKVQTGPGPQPASYTMDNRSLPAVKRPGVALTTHSHLAPRLKKE
jgi:hypothetical protein